MASPFQKYQSEQVQQINILPYTQAMSEQTSRAIAGLGKDIGDSIAKYGQAVQEREQMAQVAGGVIGEYMETTTDDKDGAETTDLSLTAPAHIKDLYNKAKKQGNGDWLAGLSGLSNTDFKAWSTLHTKYDADEKVKYQKTQDAEKLAIDRYNAETTRRSVEIQEKSLKQKQDEIDEARRNAGLMRDIQNLEVPDTQTIVDIKRRVEPTGDLYDINGEVIASNVEIRDAEEALGVKIVPETDAPRLIQEQNNFPVVSTTRWLAGSDKFDVNADFNALRQSDPIAVDRFIRETFKQASYADEALRSNPNVTKFFKGGNIEGSLAESEALKASAFRMAKGLATSPHMIKWASEQGVPQIPPNAMVRKAYVKVTGEDVREDRVLRQVDIHPEQQERLRFDTFKASYERGGTQKLPWSWEMYRALNSQRFFPRSYAPDGTPILQMGNKYVPASLASTFGSEGPPAGKEAPIDEVQANNWLGQFDKPVKVGNEIWQFKGGIRQWRGNFQHTFKNVLESGMQDMARINDIADKMIVMQQTGGRLEKALSPTWQKDYDSLNRQAQTYRRYFIATGQETEPDNARLADILADRELFDSLDPARKIRVIEAFREIVASKVRGAFQSGGGIVKGAPQKIDIKALANEAGGRTFEELQKKYGEPKK